MRVTKEEFFATVANGDVHPTPIGRFPYFTLWKTRTGRVVGFSFPDPASKHFYNMPTIFYKGSNYEPFFVEHKFNWNHDANYRQTSVRHPSA